MDYSLLLLVDEEKNKLTVGIIDYIRQYTMDKQVCCLLSCLVSDPQPLPPRRTFPSCPCLRLPYPIAISSSSVAFSLAPSLFLPPLPS
eukprot:748787-Hanusia_phi.AAC.1